MHLKPKRTPPRLDLIYGNDRPLYFVTFNTHLRRPLLASEEVHATFVRFGQRGISMGIGVGRYVIMPDHLHAFVAIAEPMTLSQWVKHLKQSLTKTLLEAGHTPTQIPGQRLRSFWQPGYMDHLLRSDESYAEKWQYVHENPVRAKFCKEPSHWPYQGEITLIDRV